MIALLSSPPTTTRANAPRHCYFCLLSLLHPHYTSYQSENIPIEGFFLFNLKTRFLKLHTLFRDRMVSGFYMRRVYASARRLELHASRKRYRYCPEKVNKRLWLDVNLKKLRDYGNSISPIIFYLRNFFW